jgi:hypothetical protein
MLICSDGFDCNIQASVAAFLDKLAASHGIKRRGGVTMVAGIAREEALEISPPQGSCSEVRIASHPLPQQFREGTSSQKV